MSAVRRRNRHALRDEPSLVGADRTIIQMSIKRQLAPAITSAIWSAVPDDVLIYLIEIAPLEPLCVIRLLEKRCATKKAGKRRLAYALHLQTTPFYCTREQILGISSRSILDLYDREVGDAAIAAFATAVGSGALPQLERLFLHNNQIGNVGVQALSAALGSKALPRLEQLLLNGNKIGDAGMQSLTTAIDNGALPQLTTLWLNQNQIRDEGMTAFAAALGSGALPKLVNLYLDGNPASNASQQAAKDAIKNRSK